MDTLLSVVSSCVRGFVSIKEGYKPMLLYYSKLIMDMQYRTAEVAASSPRFRRKSSTFVDAVHDLPERLEMAPAQLYSTESGRLFHAGKIAIATVGLPARGKT